MEETNSLISSIIAEEWRQFDRVQNIGGRASCQDDWETFRIMRFSQFKPWPRPLLESFLRDLYDARNVGWNLISEKYARMMEHTASWNLKSRLPQRSTERLSEEENIIAIHVAWNEALAKRYPNYANCGRPIHTSEDTPYLTSMETYLRGELTSYSNRTFRLYAEWIRTLVEDGSNLAEITAEITIREYGYTSLAEVERALGNRISLSSGR